MENEVTSREEDSPSHLFIKGRQRTLFLKKRFREISGVLNSEKGIALVMVLVLSAIMLVIMAGLVYMITAGTQVSGFQKRYRTALDAGVGGSDVMYNLVSLRGVSSTQTAFITDLNASPSGLNAVLTIPATCATASTAACTALGSYTGLATKLNLPTSCWSGCDSSFTINPSTNTTYDIQFDLGSSPSPTFRVYTKIVDTVLGNSGGDEGLWKSGVVAANTGEVAVVSRPYLYTIEIDAERRDNPSERAKLSILYQY